MLSVTGKINFVHGKLYELSYGHEWLGTDRLKRPLPCPFTAAHVCTYSELAIFGRNLYGNRAANTIFDDRQVRRVQFFLTAKHQRTKR